MKNSNPSTQTDSCADDYDPHSLSVNEAQERISTMLQPLSSYEKLFIRNALNRTLAENVLSTIDVPAFTNSAMDGYAFQDSGENNAVNLKIVGTAYAGKAYNGVINPGECIRIMTGAEVPGSVNTVIMQEHVEPSEGVIKINYAYKTGQNIRNQGEDLRKGEPAIKKGRCLTPSDIGVLASLGIAEVKVTRKLRAAFFSTGDELCSIGETLGQSQIYDSNRYTIHAMLSQLQIEIIDMGVIEDDPNSIKNAFLTASENADVLITSGGVSVGDADYVKQILDEIGEINFWKIAMKPGRPLAVGKVNDTYFFGLPGNPVSSMVTFYQYIQPALRTIMGQSQPENPSIQMKCVSKLKKRPGRTEFQRGLIFKNENGENVVKSTGNQGSHVLSSMSAANCFIVLSQDTSDLEAGSFVEVQPFSGLI